MLNIFSTTKKLRGKIALSKQYIITLAIGLLVLLMVGLTISLRPASKLSESSEINKPVDIINLADNTANQQIVATSVDIATIKEAINQINKKIDKLDVSIAKLNQNIDVISVQRETKLKETVELPSNLPPIGIGRGDEQQHPIMENPTAWLSNLDKDTRARVENVFKQNALQMRETIKNMGVSAENMDREAMQEMMESNQENLKNELKKVLPPEDYDKFLKSLPPLPAPPELTASPKNKQ